jgi:DNA-binding Lrp family transcriptional regulator
MSVKNYKTNATISLEQQETTRRVIIDIPKEEIGKVSPTILKNNYLRNLYADYCILNQEFLSYVVSCNLSKVQLSLLFFLMSEMDRENKILINNELLVKKLGATEKTIIEAIKKLTEKKIVIRQKLGVARYELQINYDILNPQLAFKNKATKENVKAHKALMAQETPYIKQQNIFGDIDLMHPNSGEVFYTIPNSEAHKHLIGTIKAKEALPQGYIEIEEEDEDDDFPTIEEQEELNEQLAEEQKEREKMLEATMALEEILNKYSEWEVNNLFEDNEKENPYEAKKIKLENLVKSLEEQFKRKIKYIK